MCTIATAKVQINYNCYNVYFYECLRFSLWLAIFCRTFAVAFEMQRRVKAVAQHSSSKLDSAFALHFICPANKTTALTSTLATGKQKSNN